MELGIVCLPFDIGSVIAAGRDIDEVGAPTLFGITDSPLIFDETYIMQQALLAQTSHIHVGPFCTNPQTRHWSVHSGAHNAMHALHGPRTFFGLSAGDSSVHSVGLDPADGERMAAHVRAVREHGPEGMRIQMAAGGLKTAAWAGRAADEIVIGQGTDKGAIQQLGDAALQARAEAGIETPLRRWLYVVIHMWSPEVGEDPQERERFRAIIMSYSRQALSLTHAGKNVPEEMGARLRDILSSYSFEHYGQAQNARLMEDFAEEEAFITRRYGISGTPAQVAQQLHAAVVDTGVDGVWANLVTRTSQTVARELVEECARYTGREGRAVP